MAITLSEVISLRAPATPFSGVPASSSTINSILRPKTPPCSLKISTATSAPLLILVPALGSPGGERDVSPIFTGSAGLDSVVKANADAAATIITVSATAKIVILFPR